MNQNPTWIIKYLDGERVPEQIFLTRDPARTEKRTRDLAPTKKWPCPWPIPSYISSAQKSKLALYISLLSEKLHGHLSKWDKATFVQKVLHSHSEYQQKWWQQNFNFLVQGRSHSNSKLHFFGISEYILCTRTKIQLQGGR